MVLDSGQCVSDRLLLGELLFPNIVKLNKNRVFNVCTLTKIQLQKVESKRCIKIGFSIDIFFPFLKMVANFMLLSYGRSCLRIPYCRGFPKCGSFSPSFLINEV